MPPLTGGDDVYMQEQEFGLAAHARRNLMPDPFGMTQPTPSPASGDTAEDDGGDVEDLEKMVRWNLAALKLKDAAAHERKTR
jgi:hypothetical protein